MPIRGENIGSAYVRIFGDGSSLPQDVRDAMSDADGEFETAGERHGEAYNKGFENELDKDKDVTVEKLEEAVDRGRGRLDATGGKAGSFLMEGLENKLRETFDDSEIGDIIGKNLREQLIRGASFEDIDRELSGNLHGLIEDATREITKAEAEQKKANDDWEANWRKNTEAIVRDVQKSTRAVDVELTRHTALLRRVGSDTNSYGRAFAHAFGHDSEMHDATGRLAKFNKALDQLSDTVGRMFGKGSRNNFFNLIGIMAGAFVAIPSKVIESVAAYGLRLREASNEGRLFSTIGKDLGKAVGGVAAAIAGAFVILGPFVSLVSGLLGIVVALASSIGMGLVGAVGALGGAIVPLIGLVGGLIVAFKNLPPEAQKSLSQVVDAAKGLGTVIGNAFASDRDPEGRNHGPRAFAEQMHLLAGMLNDLKPIAHDVGKALADSIDIFIDTLTKGENSWGKFIDALNRDRDGNNMGWLADHVREVGVIISNVVSGTLGLFRGLMPITGDFLDWLRKITHEFDEWANSTHGHQEIVSFMDQAADSAKALGGFLHSVNDLFWTLVTSGSDTGDSMFTSMADAIDRWNAALEKDPDILNDWFDTAESLGKAIGDILVAMGDLFDALDNAFGRNLIVGILETLAGAVDILAGALHGIADLLGVSGGAMAGFAGSLAIGALAFFKINGAINAVKANMVLVREEMALTGASATGMSGKMALAGNAMKGLAGAAGLGLLIDATHRTNQGFGLLEGAAGGALAGFSVGGPIGAAFGALGGAILGVASAQHNAAAATEAAADAFGAARTAARNFKDTLDQTTGAITENTRKQAYLALQNAKVLDDGQKLGLSQRDLVDALTGSRAAVQKVTAAMEVGQKKGGEYLNASSAIKLALFGIKGQAGETGYSLESLDHAFRKDRDEMRKQILATGDLSVAMKGVPKNVRTKVSQIGVDMTLGQLKHLRDRYDLTPKRVKTIIHMVGFENAAGQASRIARGLDIVDRKHPNPKVSLDDRKFQGTYKGLMHAVDVFGGQRPTPKADLDDGAFRTKYHSLDQFIDTFDKKNPKPEAGIIDKLTAPLNGLVRDLDAAGRKVVRPMISVNPSNSSSTIAQITSQLNNIDTYIGVEIHTTYTTSGTPPKHARGTITSGPEYALIGEEGREAVVPLDRPLAMVDPSVRWLSAIAQGKAMASGGVAGGRTVDARGWVIQTPSADPAAVAREIVNEMAGAMF